MAEEHEVIGSPFKQSESEKLAHEWYVPECFGSTPITMLDAVLWLDPDGENEDISDTNLDGTPSAVDAERKIISPFVHSVVMGERYRLDLLFRMNEGNEVLAYSIIMGVR